MNEVPAGKASFAKVQTLLTLAIQRADSAANMAEALKQRRRAANIRKAAGLLAAELQHKEPKR